ncbi:hypothetical protein Btru_016146 [Bulinus truncatus]|nr:hypothetical protein Btru_016146 [Bulinus truncatus]
MSVIPGMSLWMLKFSEQIYIKVVMSSQKVFVQFQYCPLCRINHKKGKKHVFAKRHKDIVTNVLAKFIKKIVFAKSTMKKPPIHENSWDEANKTFWCYFCQNEIEKHRKHFTATGDCIVEQGGMLEHLTRGDHVESTVKFLRENKIDLSRTSYYKLSTDDYLKYLEVVDNACSQYFKEKTDALKLVLFHIHNILEQRFSETEIF